MNTVTVKIRQDTEEFSPEEEEALRRAGRILREGGLVAFPTETVYGLGGDALNRESARRIYEAKGRPQDNPLIVHICRFEDIGRIAAEVPEEAVRIAEAFWPGPLTMILRKADCVPRETTGGLDTVAVRFPSNPAARKLIEYGGGYIAAPSANRSGRPSPTLAKYVKEDMDGRIDMILDGGEVGIGLESTILDLTVSPPQILRPGYVTREMLADVLGEVDADITILRPDSGQAPKAPGMKYRHYAPRGELVIVEGSPEAVTAYINKTAEQERSRGEKTGVIGTSELLDKYRADVVKCVGSRKDEESIARRLFAVLREFDEEGVTRIYSESFETSGLGQAIMNRLLRAAGHKVVRV
ncbi:MAG: L-threonylcarbamoyladenylate synthase [Roseburia sp.]|nr:L-threonylcarbamoyladenylate synthase [Roseburia sp.]MCM1099183.1 L-threonylcarbamoyladenylate synthase [Ruminococcus flavefaciens]